MVGQVSLRRSVYLASRATPTISHGFSLVCRGSQKCWPVGFLSGKYLRTKVWLATATGCELAVSCSESARPSTIGICIVSKKLGETTLTSALLSSSRGQPAPSPEPPADCGCGPVSEIPFTRWLGGAAGSDLQRKSKPGGARAQCRRQPE